MAPVSLKYVVSFTSQDNSHPVQNLTDNNGFKKWLSNPKEKSGQIEAVFQLEQSCRIMYIDIGLIWCAMLEIQVGRSDWPVGQDYQTLLHTASIMSPGDCRDSNNTVRTRMFGKEHFSEVTAKETWDRVRIICRQPWRKDVQFGVSFIRVKTNTTATMDKDKQERESTVHKSAKSIQKHFFGKKSTSENQNELATRLLKIAGSSEDGTEKTESLSRTAKLVIAAKDTATKNMCPTAQSVSPSHRQTLYSNSLVSKYGPKFEEEVADFLASYKIDPCDLDKITIADIRHKFEKTKRRKLTPDEKKTFIELAREYICMVFAEGDVNKDTPVQKKDRDNNHVNSDHKPDKTSIHARRNILTDAKRNQSEKSRTTPSGEKSFTERENSFEKSPPKHTPSKPGKSLCISEQKKNEVKNAASEFKKNGFSSPKTFRTSIDSSSEKDVSEEDRLKVKLVSNFGPSFTHISPKSSNKQNSLGGCPVSSPSTNDVWLSKRSPLQSSTPVNPGARGRKRALSGAGPRTKIPRTEEDECTPKRGTKSGRGRGRGKSVNSREVTPTSFERCAGCNESIPGDQLVSHTLVCTGLGSCDTSSYYGVSPDNSRSNHGQFPGMGNVLGNSNETTSPLSGLYPDVYIPSDRGPGVSEFSDQYVECPLCNEFFRQCVVERHAATCGT
ncbi:uncharacterized protein LOC117333715 [Pecten maximus]|uniref:uncharacterized protein LOC117333715 n=1 Tax=Pecten maximus TaxID=6579 RepID=UPI0014591B5E|nr:uncharacterized protein LOC117333715 [Pecten maximus]